jgi:acetylornithine deacetylase/succinyl-diaminopimelate desuccinylase-like protein
MNYILRLIVVAVVFTASSVVAQRGPASNPSAFQDDTLRHFQALVRLDTSNPPGNETRAADYLVQVLKAEGVSVQTFALEPTRANVVARLKGSGRKRPILMMGHTDVVTVDATKWTHPPFSADRDGGYIYGRGTLDNKSSVVAGLMTILELKRRNVPLDRDVIFLAESGEEGTTRVGIQFMVNQHFSDIDAEYCLAEGGGVTREAGKVTYATVQATEKSARSLQLTARGVSGHGSRPLESNAIVHLGAALERIGDWVPPIRANDITRAYFTKLSQLTPHDKAQRYRDVLDATKVAAADRFFRTNETMHSAMLHTTLSPTIIEGGYRLNVIPSEAKATIDARLLPEEDPAEVLDLIRKAVNDPAVEVAWAQRDVRPVGSSRIDTEAFRVLESETTKHYNTVTLPFMGVGATDMAYLRAKGVQCYGIGPATDVEDAAKGFGSHSDQERILESELQRFVRFHYEVVAELARVASASARVN